MALIYLLHNLIKASARSELIESSNLPWIPLSSLQLLPKAPRILHQGFLCSMFFLDKSKLILPRFPP